MKSKNGHCNIASATLRGVEALRVNVEVSVFNGLPSFSIVGMPDASIQESRERIRAALQSSGFKMPACRIVSNLAPSSIKKAGSGFDLPIAVAILAATGQISKDNLDKYLIVGELSLDGSVQNVPGELAYALCAKEEGLNLLSANSVKQSVDISGVQQLHVDNLRDFLGQVFVKTEFNKVPDSAATCPDFKDIAGHDTAKRALQIAACGNHGLLMVGPPGSGKSMLASRMPSILPPLTEQEKMDAAVIHSIAGEDVVNVLAGIRPFRSPHHSASLPGLIGGGNPVRPGEVSLAHHGVLYLDELAEFSTHVLQGVRQPMETGVVTITRADGTLTFPAKFSLIAASNPCPCGYYGDKDNECQCTQSQVRHYQNKIGGPVLDRIDMHIDVTRIAAKNVLQTGNGLSSACMKDRVLQGIEFRKYRLEKLCKSGAKKHSVQSDLSIAKIVESCNLTKESFEFFETTCSDKNMSGRGIIRVLKIARTIADLEQNESVSYDNICEALTFRLRDKVAEY